MESKKCPNPTNLSQFWLKTHYFDSNLWARGTFLTACVQTLRDTGNLSKGIIPESPRYKNISLKMFPNQIKYMWRWNIFFSIFADFFLCRKKYITFHFCWIFQKYENHVQERQHVLDLMNLELTVWDGLDSWMRKLLLIWPDYYDEYWQLACWVPARLSTVTMSELIKSVIFIKG